jgi:hypothetical protein
MWPKIEFLMNKSVLAFEFLAKNELEKVADL